MQPILGLVIPCYNEQEVLNSTIKQLTKVLQSLVAEELISPESKLFFVDDGSRDKTWSIIEQSAKSIPAVSGIKLSGNVGHQNALMAGLTVANPYCDETM